MFKSSIRLALVLLILVLAAGLVGCGGGTQEQPSGERGGEELSGTLQVNGSTTVAPVAQAWAEAFMEKHPETNIVVTGTGSGDGIAALINGTTDIAMASREMKDKEREQIKEEPVEFVVGKDGLSVVVHPSNPVSSLTMEQIKDIFTGKITNWKDVGGPDAEIIVYTRDTSSGTYAFFKEFVLEDEEYARNSRKTASNAAVVQSVAQEENSIGYVGLAYVDESIKAIAVSKDGGQPVEPSVEAAKAGEYPIVRSLYMYTIGEPEGLAKAFLDFGFSEEGQKIVEEVGYLPV